MPGGRNAGFSLFPRLPQSFCSHMHILHRVDTDSFLSRAGVAWKVSADLTAGDACASFSCMCTYAHTRQCYKAHLAAQRQERVQQSPLAAAQPPSPPTPHTSPSRGTRHSRSSACAMCAWLDSTGSAPRHLAATSAGSEVRDVARLLLAMDPCSNNPHSHYFSRTPHCILFHSN